MRPLVTVLANFHRERHLAARALRSALLAVESAGHHGVGCRIQAVIDAGDEATRAAVHRVRDRLAAVHEVDFRDLPSARNYGITRIDTKYVAMLDGDDLFDRDWLWKGVRLLEALGDERTVGHTEVRLSFGAELHGRLHIGSDSHLFHPLNLIGSWHFAADHIAPTELYRIAPLPRNDHANGLGGEDWWWTCESILEGIRHVVVPETTYFYRRQANHVSLGTVPGITFPPTRLLNRDTVAEWNASWPSAAIRFADRSASIFGARERWTAVPGWLEKSVRRACELDLDVRELHAKLDAISFETPAIFPGVGQLYLKLMEQLQAGPDSVVFFTDRLEPDSLGLLESFLAAHRRRRNPKLDVLVISLSPEREWRGLADRPAQGGESLGRDTAWMRLRHVDLGNDVTFTRLWPLLQHELLLRFLLQARPSLAVNIDSAFIDTLLAASGCAITHNGTRTVRACHAHGLTGGRDDMLPDWRSLVRAEGNYSSALCRTPEVAERLNGYFQGSGCIARSPLDLPAVEAGAAWGALLHDLIDSDGRAPDDAEGMDTAIPALEAAALRPASALLRDPDVSCIVTVRQEGYLLSAAFRNLAAMCADARKHGLTVELVIAVAAGAGHRTLRVLASLLRQWPEEIRIVQAPDDDASARNAGLGAARGRLVAILPGGDLVSPGWLAQAVRQLDARGLDTIAHPHAVVECADGLDIRYQPDGESSAPHLPSLAYHETWTGQALAARDLFRRTPYVPMPPGSGFGFPTWHWNCETVLAGCRHTTVPETAVYRRSANLVGDRNRGLGSQPPLTLPPTKFFSEHPWLRDDDRAAARIPEGWNDTVYLRRYPDVARTVAAGGFPSGYAHYRLHGRAERRVASWRIEPGIAPDNSTPSPAPSLSVVVPEDWEDPRYLRRNPDVAQAVAAGSLSSGYAHYCLGGRAEGRDPVWRPVENDSSDAGLATPTASLRPSRPEWTRWAGRWARVVIPTPLYRRAASAVLTWIGEPPPGPSLLPRWVDDEMRRLAEWEPALGPVSAGAVVDPPPRLSSIARAYRACWRMVAQARPTHIFVVPALRPGGAERSMDHCVAAIMASPAHRVLLITTEPQGAGCHGRLPAGCAWLRLDSVLAECGEEEKIDVLTRLLLHAGARCLHLFNSALGWEVLQRHAPALAAQLRIFVSIFSVPPVAMGPNPGYARVVTPLVPHLAGILTDNRRAATTLQDVCDVPPEKTVVVRHPVSTRHRFSGPVHRSRLVLWAGRIDADKRPDLLRAIALRLPTLRFHVYGESVLDGGGELARLRETPNVEYRGRFVEFDDIPTAPYHCFLYTSRWDGLPNVLLEAMRSGLLVVAPDVGGVREVVDEHSGVLVRDWEDPEAYVKALTETLARPEAWRSVAEAGRRRVTEAFTQSSFVEALRAAPGYLTNSDEAGSTDGFRAGAPPEDRLESPDLGLRLRISARDAQRSL